jgi:putative NADH-flavin reductase
MLKLLIFGATGGTGQQVVAQSLQKGYHVTVVVRNPTSFSLQHPFLTIVKGDVLQPLTFETAMRGQDVVVSCLGVAKNVPTTVYSEGIKNITNSMLKVGVQRILCISAGAVEVSPKSTWMMQFIIKNILQRLFKHLYVDMRLMETYLKTTHLNWTIIRPPWLRDTQPTGIYRTSINDYIDNASKLSRADLADYIVKHLTDVKTYKGTVEISY